MDSRESISKFVNKLSWFIKQHHQDNDLQRLNGVCELFIDWIEKELNEDDGE